MIRKWQKSRKSKNFLKSGKILNSRPIAHRTKDQHTEPKISTLAHRTKDQHRLHKDQHTEPKISTQNQRLAHVQIGADRKLLLKGIKVVDEEWNCTCFGKVERRLHKDSLLSHWNGYSSQAIVARLQQPGQCKYYHFVVNISLAGYNSHELHKVHKDSFFYFLIKINQDCTKIAPRHEKSPKS